VQEKTPSNGQGRFVVESKSTNKFPVDNTIRDPYGNQLRSMSTMNHKPVRLSLALRELKGRNKNTIQPGEANRLPIIINGSRLQFNEIAALPVRQTVKLSTATTQNVVDPTKRRSERGEEITKMMEETIEIKKKRVKQQNVVAAIEMMEVRRAKVGRHHVIVAVLVLLTT
jgi:hypothetical protein